MAIRRIITVLTLAAIAIGLAGCRGGKKADDAPWFFVQMTDPQFGFMDEDRSFTAETELMERAAEIINRIRPDFVVVTGDLVNTLSDQEQLAEVKRTVGLIDESIPVWLLPGNHDILDPASDEMVDSHRRRYGYDRFSFRHKGCSFTGLNSCLIVNDRQEAEQAQYEWLKEELGKGVNDKFRFVFMHHPLFLTDAGEPDEYFNVPSPAREKYLGLLDEYDVNAVFAGHLHNNRYGKYKNMEMITSSAIGRQLGGPGHGMTIVKVYPDRYEHEYVELDKIPDAITY